MTIRKGVPYGEPGAALAPDGVVCRSDGEVRALLERCRRDGTAPPPVGLLGGDLWRTLGGSSTAEEALRGPGAATFPVDVGEALLDGRLGLFVASLVARGPLWRPAVVVANAQWLGPWNVAPRGHPNDGRLECFDARLRLGDLRKVRRRLPTGSHLPHPRIRVTSGRAWTTELARPLLVRLDGEPAGRARTIAVRCRPDALKVTVA